MLGLSNRLVDKVKFVLGLAPVVPSSSVPKYVSMSQYDHLTVVVQADNATAVTGSAITLLQATDNAGTNAKALGFAKVWENIDAGNSSTGDTLTETAVVSNTFTTDATNSKTGLYVIEVDANTLDLANGFGFVRAGTGNGTATTISVLYILGTARYGGNVADFPTALA